MMKQKSWKAVPVLALAALTLLSSCGKKTFQKLDYTTSAVAGQYVYIKPKLDLVVFQDNSDSIANAMAQLKPQLSSFLAAMDANWEYRVIVMPLLFQQTVSQKFMIATDCSGVVGVSRCLTPSEVGIFNSTLGDSAWINSRNSATGNTDLGFNYMNLNINNLTAAGVLRPDSLKAMVVISNNDDATNVAYSVRPDGAVVSIDYTSPVTINSFNAYKNYFLNLKHAPADPVPGISLAKFYSVVAAQRYSDCYGGGMTWTGKRYMDLADALGGSSYDLCNGGLPNVLNDIRSSLATVVQTVVFNYVVLPEEPQPNTITLKKNGVTIPNSAANGWTYVGYLANQPTSYSPALGNYKSGYMIRLNGTAEFKGTDGITLDYQKK